jgi:hypothetical protein
MSQPKVGEFWAKKKIWDSVCEMKSRSGKGVIVYGNFIKMILTAFIFASLYGRPKKVIPLSPPRRAMACRQPCQYSSKVGEQVGEHW